MTLAIFHYEFPTTFQDELCFGNYAAYDISSG